MLNFESNPWTPNDIRMLRYMLEMDGVQFMRYFFRHREGNTVWLNWHHYVVEYVLQACIDHKISRLIINIPPGYGKTEQAVINFVSRGLAINPRAKFIHTSSSADLAVENSSKIKTTVESDCYQHLWRMKTRVDTKGKKRWYTEFGGGMMAAATGGQILGFRAGRMTPGFSGALINDDPLKVKHAFSNRLRKQVNTSFSDTLRSRLGNESVPIINIMQRIHDDDLSGHLLRGGSGEKWHHLCIPSYIDEYATSDMYPEDYTHGIHISLGEVLKCITNGVAYAF